MCKHKETRRTTFNGRVCIACGEAVISKRKMAGLTQKLPKKTGSLPRSAF